MCIHDCPVPIYQDESELMQLRTHVRAIQPKHILEIGSLFGGTLWYWMQDAPGSLIVSVDLGVQGLDYRKNDVETARTFLWPIWERATGCKLTHLRTNSIEPATIAAVSKNGPFDFIFIDGGHSFKVAEADFRNYWPLLRSGGLIAMHDIAYPDNNPNHFGVGRAWREVRTSGQWNEIIRKHNPEGIWGIGMVWKP